MIQFVKRNLFLILSYFLAVGLVLISLGNGFFWDTVQLGSKHATFYFESNFQSLWLPDHLDSGHIPTFGMYIAALWKIADRSLLVSHLGLLPFVIGIVWQLHKLCAKFVYQQVMGIATLLILLDPTLLSQMTLVSPDIWLVFFFLIGTNAVLSNQRWILTLSIVLLFLTSMRGMMISLCLLSLDIYCNILFTGSFQKIVGKLLKRSLIYIPALLLFIVYSYVHYGEKGWIGFHQDSPWAESFASVEFSGFLRNLGVFAWRLMDFGRIAIWGILLVLFIKYIKPIWMSVLVKKLLFFAGSLLIILPINMLWATGLLGHRYLLPIYLIIALLAVTILFSLFTNKRLQKVLVGLWIVLLISGNFWIYPPQIAQGWDATLAHLPYFELRKEALQYIEEQRISFDEVTSFFPNVATLDEIDLTEDHRNFDNFDGESSYVLYSNAFNPSDAYYEQLLQEYSPEKRFEKGGVFVILYKKK